MFGRHVVDRQRPCVMPGVWFMGTVRLAAIAICLGAQPVLAQPTVSGRSYDPAVAYQIADGGPSTSGSAAPYRLSGHTAPWSRMPDSIHSPELAPERDLLSIYGPPAMRPQQSAPSTAYGYAAGMGAKEQPWSMQLLPDGLIYRSYLAGSKESRLGCTFVHEHRLGWLWDISLGGRVGVLRWGTEDTERPEGWQIDMEGAGLPRLDFEHQRDLTAVDFRFGVPITYGRGRYQTKFGYYHLSSHLGDEFMVRNASLWRRNYARDVLVWGHSFFVTDDLRLYAEAGWAFYAFDGSEPWEFQFGVEYSPVRNHRPEGTPFFAVNGHLREELNFGGNVVFQTGWQWRGDSGHLFRLGMQYHNGMSEQFEFYDQYEDKLGFGIWYDF